MKHILKHSTGRVSFRRAYPIALRPYIAGEPVQLKVSLGLEGSPGFLSRYEEAEGRYRDTVAMAQRKASGAFDTLDSATIAYLAEAFRVQLLQADDDARWDTEERELYRSVAQDLERRGVPVVVTWKGREAQRFADKARARLAESLPIYRGLRGDGDLDGILVIWMEDALDLLEGLGMAVAPDAVAPFKLLCRALNDAAISAGDAMQKRLEGLEVPTPDAPPPLVERAASVPVVEVVPTVPLLATFDNYANAQGMTPGVREEWRNYVRLLIGFLGHDDAAKLTADDLMAWRDNLLTEPSRYGAVRKPVTVRDKYIVTIKAMLAWAVEERKLPENVAIGVKVRVPREAKLRESAFTPEEARAILTATLIPAGSRMAPGHALARRWIPWLCAYSGARVNEISQLRKEDVQFVDGVWVLRITPEAGTVKGKAARLVPLHSHIIEQGFLAVVQRRAEGPLFFDPSRTRVRSDSNRHFKKVGERLAEWVRAGVGIKEPSLQPNHAWRHLFKALSYEAGIEERMADAIQGHAPTTTGRSYGGPSVVAKAVAIEKLPRFNVDEK
ncbi:site-specific integrase [Sphingomonas sp. PAMC 26621]|uniref:site-specific integrase n=1 Tax=Sphingomonas sp. PAMC 26621 TaxID=1112213 RepID=UPI0002DDCECD|nr:site-specific integrase [Sphingomonas sp. PAMC 26621]